MLNAQMFSTLPVIYNVGLICSGGDKSAEGYWQTTRKAEIQDDTDLADLVLI